MYFGGDSNEFNFMGPSTYNRHELIQRMQNTYNKDNPLTIGDDSIYYDGRMWQMSMPEVKPTIPHLEAKVPDPSKIKIAPLPGVKTDNSNIEEVDTKTNSGKGGNNFLNKVTDFAPDIIGTGRLFDSLRTNNRVADTIRSSLNPVQEETDDE